MAGLRMSVIPCSIAKWAKRNGTLGADFFFPRDFMHLHDSTIVLPTLAYQLVCFDNQFKGELADVLAEYPHNPIADLDSGLSSLFSDRVQPPSR